MKVKNIKHTTQPVEKYEFDLMDCTTAEANALRKAIIRDVECLGIGTVEFAKNTSVYFNENISNMIELIPWRNTPNLKETSTFKIDVTCPKTVQSMFVTSKDIQGAEEFIDDDFIITKLNTTETLRATIEIAKGSGKVHAKWEVCSSNVGYELLPETKKKHDLDRSNKSYHFTVRPLYVHPIEHIMKTAVSAVISLLKRGKSSKMSFVFAGDDRLTVTIPNDHDTLSNLISTGLNERKDIEQAAYDISSRLNKESELHIIAKQPKQKYIETIDNIISRFEAIQDAFVLPKSKK